MDSSETDELMKPVLADLRAAIRTGPAVPPRLAPPGLSAPMPPIDFTRPPPAPAPAPVKTSCFAGLKGAFKAATRRKPKPPDDGFDDTWYLD